MIYRKFKSFMEFLRGLPLWVFYLVGFVCVVWIHFFIHTLESLLLFSRFLF